MKEVNDYLSKSDEELAKSINYRIYGIEGPLPESNEGDTPTPPDPPTPAPPSNLNITCSENTVTISAENADTAEYRFNEEEDWTVYTEPFNITQTVTVYAKATNEGGTTTVSRECTYAPLPPSNLNITCSENFVTITVDDYANINYRIDDSDIINEYEHPFAIPSTKTIHAEATNEGGTTTASSVCEYVQPTIPNDRIILYFSEGDRDGVLFGSLSGEILYDGSMFDYMIVDGVEYHEDFWREYIYFDNPDKIHKVQLVLKSNQPQPLPDDVFYMTGAVSAIIPSSITSIGNSTFYKSSCYSYVLPNTITSLDQNSFNENYNLTEITIPSSITRIDSQAFDLSYGLVKYTFLSTTPPVLGIGAIGVSTSPVIYVPSSSVEAYKNAEGWEDYTDYIQPIQ